MVHTALLHCVAIYDISNTVNQLTQIVQHDL